MGFPVRWPAPAAPQAPQDQHLAGFFAESDSEESEEEEAQGPYDELKAYLALPQIKYTTESDATEWWRTHSKEFPNVA
eukprot:3476190-Prymnesium_polylepis.1